MQSGQPRHVFNGTVSQTRGSRVPSAAIEAARTLVRRTALRNTRCDLLADGQRLSKAIAAAVEALARKALHVTQSFRWVAETERRWHWEVAKPSNAANSFLGSEQNACFGSASCKWSRAVRLRRRLRPALISGRSGHVRVPWMRLTDVPLRVDYVSGGQTRRNPIGPVINRG